jgi:hypothetical protein
MVATNGLIILRMVSWIMVLDVVSIRSYYILLGTVFEFEANNLSPISDLLSWDHIKVDYTF